MLLSGVFFIIIISLLQGISSYKIMPKALSKSHYIYMLSPEVLNINSKCQALVSIPQQSNVMILL